jgi:hypothetical protein
MTSISERRNETIAMDTDKNTAIMTDDVDPKATEQMDTSGQDNSVGLKEYLEGRDLDISEKEVSSNCMKIPCSTETPYTDGISWTR